MPLGPGKYDDLCTEVREKTNAHTAILIIMDGNKGSGFSCQTIIPNMLDLPVILEEMAGKIRNDWPEHESDR
jgi:hypothetical protein